MPAPTACCGSDVARRRPGCAAPNWEPGRRWVTGGCSSSIATACSSSRPRMSPASRRPICARTTALRAGSFPRPNRNRPPSPPRPTSRRVVTDYQGRGGVTAGEAFLATVPNIEARTERGELTPGIHVALLPKRTRGRAVEARLVFKFGNEQAAAGSRPVLVMLPLMLRARLRRVRLPTTGGRTRQDAEPDIVRALQHPPEWLRTDCRSVSPAIAPTWRRR